MADAPTLETFRSAPPAPTVTEAPSPVSQLPPTEEQVTFNGWMADYRPNWMAFVLYVGPQSFLGSSIVAGTEVIATPDGRGGTRQSTSTIDVSCCKLGAVLPVSQVQRDGSIIAYTFRPATQNDWNRALAAWQQQLLAVYQQQIGEANRQHALKALTDQLDANVQQMQSTGISKDVAAMRAALNAEHPALAKMQADLTRLKRDVAVRPVTCDQLDGTVSADYYGTLSSGDFYGRLSLAQNEFQTADSDLGSRLATSQKIVTATQDEIGRLDPANWGGSSVPASYLDSGRSALAAYQTVVTSAQNDQPGLEADHADVAKQAKDLLQQAKAASDAASATDKCGGSYS